MFAPKVTAPHLDSTHVRFSDSSGYEAHQFIDYVGIEAARLLGSLLFADGAQAAAFALGSVEIHREFIMAAVV